MMVWQQTSLVRTMPKVEAATGTAAKAFPADLAMLMQRAA
jgi:hypothetical protein